MTSRERIFKGDTLRAFDTLFDDALLAMGPVPLGNVVGSLHLAREVGSNQTNF